MATWRTALAEAASRQADPRSATWTFRPAQNASARTKARLRENQELVLLEVKPYAACLGQAGIRVQDYVTGWHGWLPVLEIQRGAELLEAWTEIWASVPALCGVEEEE